MKKKKEEDKMIKRDLTVDFHSVQQIFTIECWPCWCILQGLDGHYPLQFCTLLKIVLKWLSKAGLKFILYNMLSPNSLSSPLVNSQPVPLTCFTTAKCWITTRSNLESPCSWQDKEMRDSTVSPTSMDGGKLWHWGAMAPPQPPPPRPFFFL